MKVVDFTSKKETPSIYECSCSSRVFHIYDDRSVKCAMCDEYIELVCYVREELNGNT